MAFPLSCELQHLHKGSFSASEKDGKNTLEIWTRPNRELRALHVKFATQSLQNGRWLHRLEHDCHPKATQPSLDLFPTMYTLGTSYNPFKVMLALTFLLISPLPTVILGINSCCFSTSKKIKYLLLLQFWPCLESGSAEAAANRLIQTFGNLKKI